MAETFGIERGRFEPVPVGSIVRSRVPAGPGTPPDEAPGFHAFFCGSFVPLQGVPYILDAAMRAPGLDFRLVGDGPDGPRVEEELRQRRMDNVFLERRFIDRETLEKRLAAAGAVLGVFGSTAKAARVVPCKVYDGLAAGLPVVTGDSPAIRELLTDGENALLVDRDDPGSLVRALERLRDDPALAARLRAGALRTAEERFSSRAIGEQLRDRLAALVSSCGSRSTD
jgi:glycosyltransferase involved in cell wall biosynthesis